MFPEPLIFGARARPRTGVKVGIGSASGGLYFSHDGATEGDASTKGKTMKRVLAATLGLIASATLLMACSDDGGDSGNKTTAAVSTAAQGDTGGTQVTTGGGGTEISVDGKPVAGLDLATVTCVKQAGKINVGSGSVSGQQGLGIVMTDEATPKVESLGIVVDGNALAVTAGMGMSVGSAQVAVDGDTYTITGEAQGANMSNPMEGMISKDFTIKVACS